MESIMRKIYYLEDGEFYDYLRFSLSKQRVVFKISSVPFLEDGYSRLEKEYTNLPFDIWIDEAYSYNVNRFYCYRYDANKDEFQGYIVRYNPFIQDDIKDEIMRIFINNNLHLLYLINKRRLCVLELYNQMIPVEKEKYINENIEERGFDLISLKDMLPRLKSVGGNFDDNPTIDFCDDLKYKHYRKHNMGLEWKYSFEKENGELCTIWFDVLTSFFKHTKTQETIAYGKIGDDWYEVNVNGIIIPFK